MSTLLLALLACSSAPTPLEPVDWVGPEPSLDAFCSESCTVIEQREVGGLTLAVFTVGDADAELAILTDTGWWNAMGKKFRPERGRHSPGGTRFDLASAELNDGVLTIRGETVSTSMAPGEGPGETVRKQGLTTCRIEAVVSCVTRWDP